MRWWLCKNSSFPGRKNIPFLDDVYALSASERKFAIYKLLARPEQGTEQVRSQRAWKSWATKCGTLQGSRSWGLQPVQKNSTLFPRERSSVVASHTVGARSPMRLGALGAVCRSTVQPFRAHRACFLACAEGMM